MLLTMTRSAAKMTAPSRQNSKAAVARMQTAVAQKSHRFLLP